MSLIQKAETLTVDDCELTLLGGRLTWEPSALSWPQVRWKLDHSLAILTERVERLLACRDAGEKIKAAKKAV